MPTANIYVDGFNLYYGALRNRWPQYKWLDLQVFCERLLPGREVKRIRYFTAQVRNTPQNPGAANRQRIYLRALATLPKVEIHYGYFSTNDVRLPLVNPPQNGPATALVRRTEEKGSDANLAAYLLLDCCQGDCDEATVISNDSDFAEPIRLVRDVLQMSVGVINPSQRNRSVQLWQAASWSYPAINERVFRNSQLPRRLTDANGTFSKPPTW